MSFRANVVKKRHYILAKNAADIECRFSINADSLESAKLKLPNDFQFEKEIDASDIRENELLIRIEA